MVTRCSLEDHWMISSHEVIIQFASFPLEEEVVIPLTLRRSWPSPSCDREVIIQWSLGRIPEYPNTRIPKYQNTKIAKYKIPKYQNIGILDILVFWYFGYFGILVLGAAGNDSFRSFVFLVVFCILVFWYYGTGGQPPLIVLKLWYCWYFGIFQIF